MTPLLGRTPKSKPLDYTDYNVDSGCPYGSKCPNAGSKVLNLNNHPRYGMCDLKSYYLGIWTVWVADKGNGQPEHHQILRGGM